VNFLTGGLPKLPAREEVFDIVVPTTRDWMPGDFEGTLFLGEVTAFVGGKPGKLGGTLMGSYLLSHNGRLLSFENAEPFVKLGGAGGKQGKPTFKVRVEGAVGRVRRHTDTLIDWSKPFPENRKVTGNLVKATHFCFGSSLLTAAARQLLRVVCADQLAALDSPTTRIWIIGHTDRPDPDDRNMKLSLQRAKNVETALKDILRGQTQPRG
jgi:outer membrane protein OmpA-like peptidoglycan-associated protein